MRVTIAVCTTTRELSRPTGTMSPASDSARVERGTQTDEQEDSGDSKTHGGRDAQTHNRRHERRSKCTKLLSMIQSFLKQLKYSRKTAFAVALGLVLGVAVIAGVSTTVTRKRMQNRRIEKNPLPPVGTYTASALQVAVDQPGCISPSTMWSCSLPKADQLSGELPSFKVMIQSSKLKSSTIHRRDVLPNPTPSPVPPSAEDQAFLGRTTDMNIAPFAGEPSDYVISLESLTASRLEKRANGLTSPGNSSSPLPDLGIAIPPPDISADGTAAPANLLPSPMPRSQRLWLINKDQSNQAYYFYSYFDRSIFLASADVLATSSQDIGNVPGDRHGGAVETAATVRCTWTQTRFLVQIWTSSGEFIEHPGTIPAALSITLDRHGGDITTKEIFCYGMDKRQRIDSRQKKLQLEDRAFKGQLVNPALGPFGHVNVSISDGGPGGIDGGSGGCSCVFRNWKSLGNRT
jgi:hypothetical protein